MLENKKERKHLTFEKPCQGWPGQGDLQSTAEMSGHNCISIRSLSNVSTMDHPSRQVIIISQPIGNTTLFLSLQRPSPSEMPCPARRFQMSFFPV